MSGWNPSSGLRNLVNSLLNRFLAPYIENLNTEQLNLNLWSGEVVLKGLKLKKEALDKFRLPVDVIEGHIGTLHLSLPYASLGSKPVRVVIEEVFLLAVPNGETKTDLAEDERRAQAAKQERLAGAEALDMKSQISGDGLEEQKKNEGRIANMIGQIVNNLQITVRNVHVRYEDNLSTPDHPFAAGATISEFKAVSTDENWIETFISSAKDALHKMAKLSSLAIYFDTDATTIVGQGRAETISNFSKLITRGDGTDKDKIDSHQFILKPVTGEARVIYNHKIDQETPQFDAQVLFDEFGFVIDDDQYRDTLSMVDLFHFYTRTTEYRKFRPPERLLLESPAKARWRFACDAIRSEVHDRNRRWSWGFLAERRDDRKKYVELYTKMKLANGGVLTGTDLTEFQDLEKKLSYEDIRFYRSIAKSALRKNAEARRKLEAEKEAAAPAPAVGWLGWAFGSHKAPSTIAPEDISADSEQMTDADRRGLLSLVGYNPDADQESVSPDLPQGALKMRVTAKLKTGSFALRQDPHGKALDIVSVVWDAFQADVVQLSGSFDATITLGGFRIHDGTTADSVYPKIVRVKDEETEVEEGADENPFFSLRFEQNPLDGRADNAMTVKMRHLEIVYHKGYVESVVKFFKPPESQLESITALIDVASETLDQVRKDTRAGLEFALQQHKTIDVQLDMNAPIIIIPEDIRTKDCQHIILDAGHIAVQSDLVSKEALNQIESKKAQKYETEDFEKLEALMYDRFTVRLESTQLLMGTDLDSCMAALASDEISPDVHILERINMSFLVQTAILDAPNLTKFKIQGELPILQVNFSDRKYKTLMRFIDVAVPHFGDEDESGPALVRPTLPPTTSDSRHFSRGAGGFLQRPNIEEYNLDERESVVDDNVEADVHENDKFYEAPEITSDMSDLKQKTFEFHFSVEKLQASLFRSQTEGLDQHFADASLDGFSLEFALRKYDMGVDLFLRSVSLAMIENGMATNPLISSDQTSDHAGHDHDLIRFKYSRVQKDSPEFQTVYEGVDQTIAVELSTFNFQLTPVPILSLYDWIMTTFVPKDTAPPSQSAALPPASDSPEAPPAVAGGEQEEEEADDDHGIQLEGSSDKIRIRVKLTRARVILHNGARSLATLAMEAGDVSLLLRGPTLRIAATLGHLSVVDDSPTKVRDESFKRLLSVEGDDVVDFSYETFDSKDDATFPGYNSSVFLRTGSLKLNFMEGPIHDLYQFAFMFSRLFSSLNNAAEAVTAAAVTRASEMQSSRMSFDVRISTPILVFARDPVASPDVLLLRLGEIVARNDGGSAVGESKMTAGLIGISLSSEFYHGDGGSGERTRLSVMEDTNLSFDIVQSGVLDRGRNFSDADTQISGSLSDVKIGLTQMQYMLIMELLQSLPRILAMDETFEEEVIGSAPLSTTSSAPASIPPTPGFEQDEPGPSVDLRPELGTVAHGNDGETIKLYTSLLFSFSAPVVDLSLYDASATDEDSLKNRSIARFSLISTRVKLKTLSDGAMDVEVMLRDVTMANTRAGTSVWRDIIPSATHDGDQLLIHYTTSGGPMSSALAIITVDSPKLILASDPLFALLDFFTSAFPAVETPPEEAMTILPQEEETTETVSPAVAANSLSFRIEIVKPTILILESDSDSQTQAIQLTLDQLLVAHQGILALNIQKIGMSLLRMDQPKETVRFLDDIDLTLSIDSRQVATHQMTDIELQVQPIIFRASYRDIMLITDIVNKAIALASRPSPDADSNAAEADKFGSAVVDGNSSANATSMALSSRRRSSRGSIGASPAAKTSRRRSTVSRGHRPAKPKVILSKEHLKATIDGFQLILIGDLHELPLLHLHTKPFTAEVHDWSGDLKFLTSSKVSIKYYNLTNSAWEPLLEPWQFMFRVARSEAGGEAGKMSVTFSSKERLELNVTSSFIELAITSYTQWTKESDRILKNVRGGDAPYLVRNRTGYPIEIWADGGKTARARSRIEDGAEMRWRFEDYKTLREHVGELGAHTLGIHIADADWEQLRNVSVDREGGFPYPLLPRINKNPHRLICDVRLVDNVKIVTLRSPLRVENQTLIPVELIIIEKTGKPGPHIYKIAPGEACPLPIEAAYHKRFKIRPDPGFDFSWSMESLHWEDLKDRTVRAIECRSRNKKEAPFRFQSASIFEESDPHQKRFPNTTLRLRAPIEIENLLPYDIKYRVFDKNTSLNSSTFLRKGGVSPVHQVELSHLLLLSVQVQDTDLKPSDFAIINTDNPDDFAVEDVLLLPDSQDRKLKLRVNYVKYQDPSGAFKVQVYSPYIFLNKSGLPLQIRSKTWMGQPRDIAGGSALKDDHLRERPTPIMFSFGTNDRRNKCFLKYGDSAWSKPLSFETVAADLEVLVETANGQQEIHTGLSYIEGLGKYKLTKVITLTPRFIFKNKLGGTINFRQEKSQSFVHLTPGEQAPLHELTKSASEPRVVIAYPGVNQEWSAPFNILDIGRVHVTLRKPAQEGHRSHRELIRVEVLINGPSIFIQLSKETDPWPFRIQNNTDAEIEFCQTDVYRSSEGETGPRRKRTLNKVGAHSSAKYTWDLPAEYGKRICLMPGTGGRSREVDVMEIGILPPMKIPGREGFVSLDVRVDGPTQLLVISKYEEQSSAFKPAARGSLSRSSTMDSTMAFEAVATDISVTMTVNVELEGVGISVLNRTVHEMVYLSFRGLELKYIDTVSSYSASFNCKWIQVDNQLFGGLYPIVLYPSMQPKDAKDLESHPTLQTSVIVLKDASHGVLFVKYASILLQAMTIELDEDFVFALYDFSLFKGASWQEAPEDVLIEHPGPIPDPPPAAGGAPVYFESLALQPVQLELSFMRTEHVNVEEKQQSTRNPFFFFLNALTMALGNVNAAPVRLNALMIENVRLSPSALQGRIILHYTNQFTSQLYRILGSADAFGNPVGLFSNVSSGVQDIFYEPYQGFVLHGNKDLASGIARGATSFVKKTVFGVSDSISKVTGSIGKGISAATLDPEYQSRRRMAQRRNKPQHALYGFAAGAQAFGTSVASGLEGLALKPIEGAERGGAGGFLKGVGKGLVGIVTKPVVGVFDFASTATQGIRNTTTVFDGTEIDRVRLPRVIAEDGILRPFNEREALGQTWLKDLDNGKYFNETYVAHLDMPEDDYVCMLTTTRILRIRSLRLRVVWEVAFSDLTRVLLEPNGIGLVLRGGVDGPFLALPEQGAKVWIFGEISRVIERWNRAKAAADST